MTDLSLSSRALLSLLQWCDSLFPSGAFSHSFGLESAVQSDKVKDQETLSDWIREKLAHQIFPCDLVILSQSYEACLQNDLEHIQSIDESAFAMRLPKEVREGGKMIASRLIQTAVELYPSPWTRSCLTLFKSARLKGDPAVAFGIAAFSAGTPADTACLGYIYLFISGQVSAALRLLQMGQQAGQQMIHQLLDWTNQQLAAVEETTSSSPDPMTFMPAAEIACMRHEIAPMRLFQS